MEGASGDLPGKYQKLATEYSKLRAQAVVLKKAVLEEQAKALELREFVKEKDQSIRKYEQEIDSLTFRNQQLSKRVVILQEELDEITHKSKKNKRKGSDVTPSSAISNQGVYDEELRSKIDENARLHRKVIESDEEHQEALVQLKEKLSRLELESSQHHEILHSTIQKNKAIVDKLQQDKAYLEARLQSQEKELKEARLKVDVCEQQLRAVHSELSTKLEVATHIISNKLPFNDTKFRDINALNVPAHDRKHQLQARELLGQAMNLVRDLVTGLSNFHTYTEQRSQIYPIDSSNEPLSPVNIKFCEHLHRNMQYLRPIEQSFRSVYENAKEDVLTTLETVSGLQNFAAKFNRYVAYLNILLPYQLLSLEEECAVSSCTTSLEAKNMQLHSSIAQLTAVYNKLDSYISIIAQQSDQSCDHPRFNQKYLFIQLSKTLTELHEITKTVYKHYNSKVSLEHQLPTAAQTLKTTDECVVSALISLVTRTSKLSTLIASNLEFFTKNTGLNTHRSSRDLQTPKTSPLVSGFRNQAASYISILNVPCSESVPYQVALENRKLLFSFTESRDSHAKQITSSMEKISRLEQEKEHWLLETQLLQVKYEKQAARLKSQQNNFQTAELNVFSPNKHLIMETKPGPSQSTSSESSEFILGTLDMQFEIGGDGDSESREKLIKNHFRARLTELTSHLQLADGKAVNLYAECCSLQKQLSLAEKSKNYIQDELAECTQQVSQLKDELQTTTKSYEGQLSMMSEHLAHMNEKLSQQKDEIDALKYAMNSKASRKDRSK